ncbi:MAG: fimbrillin family protein [Bacteroidales bacterium]|nr:fimbrillin family protein [Bacteroidales bacterium]
MKKIYLIVAIGAALGACTSETDIVELEAPQSITLQTVTQKSSRAAFDGSTLPVKTPIYVTAYNKITEDDGTTSYNEYLKNVEFTCYNPNVTDPNNRFWTANYYYPTSGDVDFIAYTCDYSDQENDYFDQVKPTKVDVSIDEDAQRITGMNLEFGELLKGQTDVTYSSVASATRLSNGTFAQPVLSFRHGLAWIVVNFLKGSSDAEDDAMLISHVKVKNVNLSGSMDLTIDADNNYNVEWTANDTKKDAEFPAYEDIGDDGIAFGDAAGAETKGILVLPCDEQVITFKYCTKSGENSYTGFTEYTTTLDNSTLAGHKWEAGKKYIYNFTITSNKIQFTTTVTDFDSNYVNNPIK